jgi:hypothetical protein
MQNLSGEPMTRTTRRGWLSPLLATALLAFSALASAQPVFRITAIPDESPTELARKAGPLIKYLEAKLGMKVEYTPVTDYAASVEALVNKKVDMAWFGGFTFVQANVRSGGKMLPLVQREEDEKFRSVFITSDPSIQKLADLKGKDVSFGSQSSHQRPPDAAQLPAAGRAGPRQGFQARGLQRRARRDDCRRGFGQGAGRGAEHLRLGQVRGRQEGRPGQGARVLHHARLLRLQLDRARRHARRTARKAQRRRCWH